MKYIMTFLSITLIAAFFAGCTPSVEQATPDNKTDERTNAVKDNNVSQTEDQEEIKGAKAYIGKHLLVGLSYRDSDGEVTKHVQIHGVITRITTDGIFFDRADGKGEFALPPDLESLKPTIPGAEYRLKSTGEVVRNVDYIGNWTIDAPPDE